MKDKTIRVNYLARVEGEGSLHVKLKGDEVSDVKLKIFEPPRFFEALLRGRKFTEAPDITARICGICPIAYELGASQAMEDVCGVSIPVPLKKLRRLIYCGEWIESHTLHMFMLHAPDFLGYDGAVQMAKDHPKKVETALRLKKIGNQIMSCIGGREIHPINLRLGGFYKIPLKKDLDALIPDLEWGIKKIQDSLKWMSEFDFPEFEKDYEFVALRHSSEYAITEGKIVSNKGLDIGISEYEDHFIEDHVEHSTALHSTLKEGRIVQMGPMARFNLNFDKLTPLTKRVSEKVGLSTRCLNPFKSILIRGIEVLYAFEEALRLVNEFKEPSQAHVEVNPREGKGCGATEAPRGICFHRYIIDQKGTIKDAKIVAPTSVNQKSIEDDLWKFIPSRINKPEKELQWECEQAIRNYDPCISCSAHFLKLEMTRE